MRVLVDTSAWIDFFRQKQSSASLQLEDLIRQEVELCTCGLIAAEFLQGIRPPERLNQMQRHFLDMTWLQPREPQTYLAAADLYRRLRSQGLTIRSTIDCLIACLANENGVYVLFNDQDLDRIAESGLCPIRPLPFQ